MDPVCQSCSNLQLALTGLLLLTYRIMDGRSDRKTEILKDIEGVFLEERVAEVVFLANTHRLKILV